MNKKSLSRRDFLKISGSVSAGAALGGRFGVPAFVRQVGEPDLSSPEAVGKALQAEGSIVTIHSWGFGGLAGSAIPSAFAEYTKRLYGVPVVLSWLQGGDLDTDMTSLPLAGKIVSDVGIDVVDKEEDAYKAILALEWDEPINLPQYLPLLTQLNNIEAPYLFHEPDMAQDGADIYGLVYQGYEWLGPILRKDKVDVANYKDWTDLAREEMVGKGVDYAFNDNRGALVFVGILNSLITQGIVSGDLWSEEAWEAGITWWKDNLEDKVGTFGDIGNDPTIQLKLQTGDAWWAATWGSYVREFLGKDWNKEEDVLSALYPVSGIAADRETLHAAKGALHPIAARILIDWFATDEFQNAGWYKETEGGEAINHWNITESNYLTAYAGGIQPSNRAVAPEWAKPYYPENPGDLVLPVNWSWYVPRKQWISDTYDRIVKGI